MLICLNALALESISTRLYEVTTETVMPHVEENLRYATTREKRCLGHAELSSAFPILSHESLNGCKLAHEKRVEDSVTYLLICEGGNGTTGTAQWLLGADQVTGRLDVKLGGKNMTFTQRITAKPVGECTSNAN